MEWGIINKENFNSIAYVPIKRWDPLSTTFIRTKEFGFSKRQVRYYGHYSYISPIRGSRGKGFKKSEVKKCLEKSDEEVKDVFTCITDGNSMNAETGEGFTILITEDEERKDYPFLDQPHILQARIPDSCKALTLINRYPSMARIIDSDIKAQLDEEMPSSSKVAVGITLLTLSRHFYPALYFDQIPADVLSGIFLSMKAAIVYSIEKAIEADYYDIPVSPFFNIGSQVGGSQPRIHSQVYIDLNGDGLGSRLEGYLEAFKEMGNNCHLCETRHGDSARIVLETLYWTFFTTGSPIRNYHLRFYPKEHLRRFSNLNINQIQDLAKSLKIVFGALDKINISEDRNILFNCCPYGYDANFHMFGDIIPHEIIGGAEMADDMRVARKLPETAAKELRDAISRSIT